MGIDFLGNRLPRLAAPLFPSITWRGPSHAEDGSPTVYLTFDDGPHPVSTPTLLKHLYELEANAHFFVTGENAIAYPDLLRQLLESRHVVGNHGWTHNDPWKSKRNDMLNGLQRTNEQLGDEARFVRPPYGRFTPALLKWAKARDQRVVLWDVMPGDFLNEPVEDMADRMTRWLRPGSILVLHDTPSTLQNALELVSVLHQEIARHGWIFGRL